MTKFKLLMSGLAIATLLTACSGAGTSEEKTSDSGAMSQVAAQMDSKYTVYFRRKSTRLTTKSEGVLYDAMQAIRMKKAKNVRVVVYSVSQRNKRRSQKLASRRIRSLEKRLKEAGAKNIEVTDGGMLKSRAVGGASRARKAEIILQ